MLVPLFTHMSVSHIISRLEYHNPLQNNRKVGLLTNTTPFPNSTPPSRLRTILPSYTPPADHSPTAYTQTHSSR